MPLGLLSVAADPGVDELIVISLPAVPLTLNVPVMVVVVADVSVSVRAFVLSEKLRVLNVLDPETVSAPVEPATM